MFYSRYFNCLMISICFASSAHAKSKNPVIHQIHHDLLGCIDRFHQTVEEKLNLILSDYHQSEKEKENALKALDEKWFLFGWADKIYDKAAQGKWDWEHPDQVKTESGKIRAYSKRMLEKQREFHQLKDVLNEDTSIYPRLNSLFAKTDKLQTLDLNEWHNIRALMQKREQAYYDFIGDQARQQVYERGFVNVIVWNRTMGLIQDHFYRNVSCVTVIDQQRMLVPKSMIDQHSYQLVEDQSKVSTEI